MVAASTCLLLTQSSFSSSSIIPSPCSFLPFLHIKTHHPLSLSASSSPSFILLCSRLIFTDSLNIMPDRNQVENLLDNLSKLAEDSSNTNSTFFEPTRPVFGRQKSVHHTLGGGTSADVLLWRNKKVSASVLSSATAVWILFEWLNYNFLTLVSFVLIIGLLAQFMWSNASNYFMTSESPSQVPRIVLPDELFIKIAITIGKEANKALGYLQDISCSGNLKQLILVIGSLLTASLIGTWCNFLTVIYIGFVAAHTLPVLYEKYEDEFDSFVSQAFRQIESNYRKLDVGVLQRLPTRNLRRQKYQ